MITVIHRVLKSEKKLASGGSLAIGTKLIAHVLLNQDGEEGRAIKEDTLRNADADHVAAKRRGLKGKELKPFTDAVKLAQAKLDGVKYSGSELFLMVQGVHPVKLSPAEKGVLMAALKGLTVTDLAE